MNFVLSLYPADLDTFAEYVTYAETFGLDISADIDTFATQCQRTDACIYNPALHSCEHSDTVNDEFSTFVMAVYGCIGLIVMLECAKTATLQHVFDS